MLMLIQPFQCQIVWRIVFNLHTHHHPQMYGHQEQYISNMHKPRKINLDHVWKHTFVVGVIVIVVFVVIISIVVVVIVIIEIDSIVVVFGVCLIAFGVLLLLINKTFWLPCCLLWLLPSKHHPSQNGLTWKVIESHLRKV